MELSIVVIGYNVEKYIEKCLKSILCQVTDACEILFIDDGSEDKTKEIVKTIFYEQEGGCCRYLNKKNEGANSARVLGYKEAKGKYITFVDGDDWVEGEYISCILKNIKQQPDIIIFNFQYVFENNRKEINSCHADGLYREKQFLQSVLEGKELHYLWNKVYSAKFLKSMPFEEIPQITMGDDLAAHTRMGIMSPVVVSLKEVLYNYYCDGTGVSRRPSWKTVEILRALEDMESVLEKANMENEFRILIDYHYFRAFLFYVVRNKYGWTYVQKEIYQSWKKKKINIGKNIYIRQYMKNKRAEMFLGDLYNISPWLGNTVASLYLKMVRGRAR